MHDWAGAFQFICKKNRNLSITAISESLVWTTEVCRANVTRCFHNLNLIKLKVIKIILKQNLALFSSVIADSRCTAKLWYKPNEQTDKVFLVYTLKLWDGKDRMLNHYCDKERFLHEKTTNSYFNQSSIVNGWFVKSYKHSST